MFSKNPLSDLSSNLNIYLAMIALVLAGTIIDKIGGVEVLPVGVGVLLDGVGVLLVSISS